MTNHFARLGIYSTLSVFILTASGEAAVFRCVDANGSNTYSDKPCAPVQQLSGPQSTTGENRAAGHADAVDPKDKKAAHILEELRLISAQDSDAASSQKTIDLIAPDLVKALDAANPAWTPQQPKWHAVLEFVKSDLRKDVQPALRASNRHSGQAAAHQYAAHAMEADMEGLQAFLDSADGAKYIAYQNELRSIANQAYESLMAQEEVTPEKVTDAVLKRREQLLSLGIDSIIATEGRATPQAPATPGASTIIENAARREGTALDTLYSEFETSLPSFVAFTQSTMAKRFFVDAGPALRVNRAESSIAIGQFADAELTNYGPRWAAFYGPPARASGRVTTVTRVGSVGIVSSRQVNFDGGRVARESAAIQCEQRENANYSRTHPRMSEINTQAALKNIQNTCRGEQSLPPL
jgi:hypothetical protein